jgi:hypothetical protein
MRSSRLSLPHPADESGICFEHLETLRGRAFERGLNQSQVHTITPR